MTPLIVLLAGALTAATPKKPGSLTDAADYPSESLQREEQGFAVVLLTISAEGKPEHCELEASSGFRAIDRVTCQSSMRARFKPARDSEGRAMPGVYRHAPPFWLPPDPRPNPPQTELDLVVQKLPAGIDDGVILPVNILVDAAGAISLCTADDSEAGAKLGKVACEQVRNLYAPKPAIGKDETAIASIQTVRVAFRVQAPQQPLSE